MERPSLAIRTRQTAILLAVAALLPLLRPTHADAQTTVPAVGKIDLRILYAGHAGSPRETDFVDFLKQYFREVQTIDLARFTGQEKDFDVAILDSDYNTVDCCKCLSDYFPNPHTPTMPPKKVMLPNYSRPTVTVGEMGALICSILALKTGHG